MSKKISQLLLLAGIVASSFAGLSATGSYLSNHLSEGAYRSMVSAKSMNCEGEESCGSSIGVRFMYQRSYSGDTNRHFLPAGATTNTVAAKATPGATDIALNYLTRVASSGAAGTMDDATLTMNPTQTRMAVAVSYAQSLKNVLEGAWFDLNASFARVENNLKATYTGGAKNTTSDTFENFFKGTTFTVGASATSTLTAGKILWNTASPAANGLEEVRARLGYDFVTNDNGTFGGYVSGVVGFGTEPKLDHLFESVVGHRHVQLGAGMQGRISLSQTEESSMALNLDARAHYIFARNEVRMANLQNVNIVTGNTAYQQYYLVKDTTAASTAGWSPAANILRREVSVRPQYSADLAAQFVYSNDCTSFDAGYVLSYKAKEKNELDSWTDTQYVTAGSTADSNLPVASAGANSAVALKKEHLNFNEEAKLIHNIHAGLNYCFNDMANPMDLGFGGEITMAPTDKAKVLQHWGVFGKLAVNF
ncbi:hypothetical protein FJ366_02270 [Candidatus Dependentiae bacterium]|nr:hypothetical protein [Candidatus Dependentiae bacterium]